MSHKAIIFDFFGVIHDDPQKQWLPHVEEHRHKHVSAAARRLDTGTINLQEYYEELAAASGHTVEKILEHFAQATVNSEVVKTIRRLRSEFTLCLLSNAASEEIWPILKRHGLDTLFHEIVISSEVGMAKPDAGIFKYALEKVGSLPEKTIFIDDNDHNVAAAGDIGIHTIHFRSSEQLNEDLEKITNVTAA